MVLRARPTQIFCFGRFVCLFFFLVFYTKIYKFWLKIFENKSKYFPKTFLQKLISPPSIFVFLGSFLLPENNDKNNNNNNNKEKNKTKQNKKTKTKHNKKTEQNKTKQKKKRPTDRPYLAGPFARKTVLFFCFFVALCIVM